MEGGARINLKCDPALAQVLRSQFEGVLPGYHQDKRHWNTVLLDGSVPREMVEDLVRHSYGLVVAGLPKRARDALGAQR